MAASSSLVRATGGAPAGGRIVLRHLGAVLALPAILAVSAVPETMAR
jgi:hypothetical protein